MQWLTPWTIICAVLCVLALVVLFFPFIFKIDFNADARGILARLFLFKKQLYKYEKKFSGEDSGLDDGDSSIDKTDVEKGDANDEHEEDVVPAYVPPPKKIEPKTVESEQLKTESPKAETLKSEPAPTEGPVKADAKTENPAKTETTKKESAKPAERKEEKRSLTDREFWTILLTPEFDDVAFWAIKKWTLCLLRLFRFQFRDCYVEGIRSDVMNMGYGAALNGIMKGYPYLEDWDIRMDWTRDHELRSEGHIDASVNLCRTVGLLIATVFYGGIIVYKFWRRRAHVLKTNELPELGWIRTKIVKMMAEE